MLLCVCLCVVKRVVVHLSSTAEPPELGPSLLELGSPWWHVLDVCAVSVAKNSAVLDTLEERLHANVCRVALCVVAVQQSFFVDLLSSFSGQELHPTEEGSPFSVEETPSCSPSSCSAMHTLSSALRMVCQHAHSECLPLVSSLGVLTSDSEYRTRTASPTCTAFGLCVVLAMVTEDPPPTHAAGEDSCGSTSFCSGADCLADVLECCSLLESCARSAFSAVVSSSGRIPSHQERNATSDTTSQPFVGFSARCCLDPCPSAVYPSHVDSVKRLVDKGLRLLERNMVQRLSSTPGPTFFSSPSRSPVAVEPSPSLSPSLHEGTLYVHLWCFSSEVHTMLSAENLIREISQSAGKAMKSDPACLRPLLSIRFLFPLLWFFEFRAASSSRSLSDIVAAVLAAL